MFESKKYIISQNNFLRVKQRYKTSKKMSSDASNYELYLIQSEEKLKRTISEFHMKQDDVLFFNYHF
jgi:hypothetical protein